jgi:hypothetical protein
MSATLYSARWYGPSLIERDKAQTISVSIERNGSNTTLTSGTLTIFKPNGEKLVDGVAGTVASGTFTSATIAAASTVNEELGPRWLIQVDLVISGATVTFYNDAVLCLGRLYPPIGQTDLIQRHSEAANLLGAAVSSLQQYIDQAWRDVTVRLYGDGCPFWKWRTPAALRSVLFNRAFELLFFDYSTLLNGSDRYATYADRYAQLYEREYEALISTIDKNEDNTLSSEMVGGSSVILLSGTRRRRWRNGNDT